MLDHYLATTPAVRQMQSRAAGALHRAGVGPNLATLAGGVAGVLAGLAFAWGWTATGLMLLLASAALDGIDGTIAREFGTPSAIGGVLDLCADRVVEAAVIIGIAWRHPALYLPGLVLVASWYMNITVFLAVGAALERRGPKLIQYPPGILERTEAIIFFVILAVAGPLGPTLCYIFTALELMTGAQRMRFGLRELRSVD